MLINNKGEKQGIISIDEALDAARSASLDLVQVSPSDASPVVCKLMDYGKHLFDKKKALHHQKIKLKEIQLKKLNLDHQLMLETIKLN